MADTKANMSSESNVHVLQKEWDEVSCPICMEHPHNAVLLVCTSHENGCRSYICDTSYRHSNCLDRFKNLQLTQSSSSSGEVEKMKCPLCRGNVTSWKVVKEARQYWDTKLRCCSRESCTFCGNYGDLRKHARRAHPLTRPADVDPTRQRAWRRMEHEREYGDILSAIRAAMPGAVMLGDYAVDDDNNDGGRDLISHHDLSGPWWATLFLYHMMSGPFRPRDEFRASFRRRRRRSSSRQHLWGENLIGLRHDDDDDGEDGDDDDHDDDDGGDRNDDDSVMPRRRRRLTRSRHDEEQQ